MTNTTENRNGQYQFAQVGVSETIYVDNEGLSHIRLGNGKLMATCYIRPLFEKLNGSDFNVNLSVPDPERQGNSMSMFAHRFDDRPLAIGENGVTYQIFSNGRNGLIGRPLGSCLGILSKKNAPLMLRAYEEAKRRCK